MFEGLIKRYHNQIDTLQGTIDKEINEAIVRINPDHLKIKQKGNIVQKQQQSDSAGATTSEEDPTNRATLGDDEMQNSPGIETDNNMEEGGTLSGATVGERGEEDADIDADEPQNEELIASKIKEVEDAKARINSEHFSVMANLKETATHVWITLMRFSRRSQVNKLSFLYFNKK